jgi:hypothetical protein
LRGLLSAAMLLYSAALVLLPFVRNFAALWTFAALVGLTGGFITVIFFAIWSHAFGKAHLGRIQGAAQLLTVLASALGTVLFAKCVATTDSHTPLLLGLAVVVLVLGLIGFSVPLPSSKPAEARIGSTAFNQA